jgi:Ca2+-binding EF-hand superfamily protein
MEVDVNGDDFQEFLGMMDGDGEESGIKEAFQIFDRDKNGYFDMNELKKGSFPLK